jgi:hypothetical protein
MRGMGQSWRSSSGLPLSSSDWLEAHPRAKLVERLAFAKQAIEFATRSTKEHNQNRPSL